LCDCWLLVMAASSWLALCLPLLCLINTVLGTSSRNKLGKKGESLKVKVKRDWLLGCAMQKHCALRGKHGQATRRGVGLLLEWLPVFLLLDCVIRTVGAYRPGGAFLPQTHLQISAGHFVWHQVQQCSCEKVHVHFCLNSTCAVYVVQSP